MMPIPTREIYWNIQGYNILYAVFIIALIIFAYGFYRRYRLWRLGGPERRIDQVSKRLWSLFRDGLAQISVLKEASPGLMHIAIYGGFVVLTIGTILVLLQADFSLQILYGSFYLWYSLILDLFGVLFLLGLLYAAFRRYILRPERLNRLADDAVILSLLFIIGVSGFIIEGARLAATQPAWAAWSPVGQWIASWFASASPAAIAATHRYTWWFHLLISMGFIAYIPFSKLFHIFTAPANQFFKTLQPKGQLAAIDMEKAENFGVTDLTQFTWKQLLDLDACTECGRCQDQCPAFNSRKPLSPKKIIIDLQTHMSDRGVQVLQLKKKGEEIASESPVGTAVADDEIWACTTCMACQHHCPVAIEHIQKIVDLRRARVMMDSQFPQELNTAFRGLETNANPWNMGQDARADWMQGLNIPLMAENPQVDYLWFVGCAGCYDDRARDISRALATILQKAGVSFAVLGVEEKCCGDPARRAGNEYVFQMLAEENMATFKQYTFKKILTACPHGYHMIKNEYRQFGGEFEVIHHSELIAGLIKDGKLALRPEKAGSVTYHDSCYLGRYNDIYLAPRTVLAAATGSGVKELPRSKEKSFCCGAGGGRMFMEETLGDRINHLRVQEIADSGASVVASACPFCLDMLDDGAKEKGLEEKIKVKDIAQIVAEKMNG
ncbi:4Fe-4S dicluster domain-containing protein [candidate division KSB1 bacterium]|nr:4Fe-4S dicluster domain-containing protein [candidate division KSB1 bacterium]